MEIPYTPTRSKKAAQLPSFGSVPFVVTSLLLLASGGSLLLAFLPFQTTERVTAAPRRLPEILYVPTPPTAPAVTAQPTAVEEMTLKLGPVDGSPLPFTAMLNLADSADSIFRLSSAPREEPQEQLRLERDDQIPGGIVALPQTSLPLNGAPAIPTQRGFDAVQNVAVPEPATALLLPLALAALAAGKALRRFKS